MGVESQLVDLNNNNISADPGSGSGCQILKRPRRRPRKNDEKCKGSALVVDRFSYKNDNKVCGESNTLSSSNFKSSSKSSSNSSPRTLMGKSHLQVLSSVVLFVFCLNLFGNVPHVEGVCVWQGGGTFRLACGFRQSGLFRIRSLGGLKGYLGAGFTIGDEDGFKDSLTNTDPKQTQLQQQQQGYGAYQRNEQNGHVGSYSTLVEQKTDRPTGVQNPLINRGGFVMGQTAGQSQLTNEQHQRALYLQQIQAQQMLEHQVLQQKAAMQNGKSFETPPSPFPSPEVPARGGLTKRASLWGWPKKMLQKSKEPRGPPGNHRSMNQGQSRQQHPPFNNIGGGYRGPGPRAGPGTGAPIRFQDQENGFRIPMAFPTENSPPLNRNGQDFRSRNPHPTSRSQNGINNDFSHRRGPGGPRPFPRRLEDKNRNPQRRPPFHAREDDNRMRHGPSSSGQGLPHQMMIPPTFNTPVTGPSFNTIPTAGSYNPGDVSHLQGGGDGRGIPHGLQMLQHTNNFGSLFKLVDQTSTNEPLVKKNLLYQPYSEDHEFVEEEEQIVSPSTAYSDDVVLSGIGTLSKEALATAVYDANIFPDIYFTSTTERHRSKGHRRVYKPIYTQEEDLGEDIHRVLPQDDHPEEQTGDMVEQGEKKLETSALHTNENIVDSFVESPAVLKKKLKRRRKKFRLMARNQTGSEEPSGRDIIRRKMRRKHKKPTEEGEELETDALQLSEHESKELGRKALMSYEELISNFTTNFQSLLKTEEENSKESSSSFVPTTGGSNKLPKQGQGRGRHISTLKTTSTTTTTTAPTTTTTTTTAKPTIPMTNFRYNDALDRKQEAGTVPPSDHFQERIDNPEPGQDLFYDPRYPPNHEVNRGRIPSKFVRQRGPALITTTTATPKQFHFNFESLNSNSYESAFSKPKPSVESSRFAPTTEHGAFVKFDSQESIRSIEKTKLYNDHFYSNHFNRSTQQQDMEPSEFFGSGSTNFDRYNNNNNVNHQVVVTQKPFPKYQHTPSNVILPWEISSTAAPPSYSQSHDGFRFLNPPSMTDRPAATSSPVEESWFKKNLFGGSSMGDEMGEMAGNWEAPNFWGNIQQVDRFGPSADFVTNDNFKRVLDLEEKSQTFPSGMMPLPPTEQSFMNNPEADDQTGFFGSTTPSSISRWGKHRRKQKSGPSTASPTPIPDHSIGVSPSNDISAGEDHLNYNGGRSEGDIYNNLEGPSTTDDFFSNLMISSTTEMPQEIKEMRSKHGRRRKQKRPEVQIKIKGESKPRKEDDDNDTQVVLPNTQEVSEILEQEDKRPNQGDNSAQLVNFDRYSNNNGIPGLVSMNNGQGSYNSEFKNVEVSDSIVNLLGSESHPSGLNHIWVVTPPTESTSYASSNRERDPFANLEPSYTQSRDNGDGFISQNNEFRQLSQQIKQLNLVHSPQRRESDEQTVLQNNGQQNNNFGSGGWDYQRVSNGGGLPEIVPSPPDPVLNVEGPTAQSWMPDFVKTVPVLMPPPPMSPSGEFDSRRPLQTSWRDFERLNEVPTSTERSVPPQMKPLSMKHDTQQQQVMNHNNNNAQRPLLSQSKEHFESHKIPTTHSLGSFNQQLPPNQPKPQLGNNFQHNVMQNPTINKGSMTDNVPRGNKANIKEFYPPSRDESTRLNDNPSNFHPRPQQHIVPPKAYPSQSLSNIYGQQQGPHAVGKAGQGFNPSSQIHSQRNDGNHNQQNYPVNNQNNRNQGQQQNNQGQQQNMEQLQPKYSYAQNEIFNKQPVKYNKAGKTVKDYTGNYVVSPPPLTVYPPPVMYQQSNPLSKFTVGQHGPNLPANVPSPQNNFNAIPLPRNPFIPESNQPKPTKIPAQMFEPPRPPPPQKSFFSTMFSNPFGSSNTGPKPNQNRPQNGHPQQNSHHQQPSQNSHPPSSQNYPPQNGMPNLPQNIHSQSNGQQQQHQYLNPNQNHNVNPFNMRYQPPGPQSYSNQNGRDSQQHQGLHPPPPQVQVQYIDLEGPDLSFVGGPKSENGNRGTPAPPPKTPVNKPKSDKQRVIDAIATLNTVKYDVIQSVAEDQFGPEILEKIKAKQNQMNRPPSPPTTTTTTARPSLFPFLSSLSTTLSPLTQGATGSFGSLFNLMGQNKAKAQERGQSGFTNLFGTFTDLASGKGHQNQFPSGPTPMVSLSTDSITNLFTSLGSDESGQRVSPKTTPKPMAPELSQDIKSLQAQLSKAILAKAGRNKKLKPTGGPFLQESNKGAMVVLNKLAGSKNYTAAQIATLKKLIALNNIEQKLGNSNDGSGNDLGKSSVKNNKSPSLFSDLFPSLRGTSSSSFSSKMLQDGGENVNQVQNNLLMMQMQMDDPALLAFKKFSLKNSPPQQQGRDPTQFKPIPVDLTAILSPSPPTRQEVGRPLLEIRNAPKSFYPGNATLGFDPVNSPQYTDFTCESQSYFPGLYADTNLGCKVFHLCAKTPAGYLMKSFRCPKETVFDQEVLRCNWNLYVECPGAESKYHFNKYLSQSFQFLKVLGEFSAGYQHKPSETSMNG